MKELQIISKVLEEKDLSILLENNINADYFNNYKQEFLFILEHNSTYNSIPTKETFLEKYPTFELVSSAEKWEYLVEAIKEEYMFSKLARMYKESAEITKDNAYQGYEYIKQVISELENIKSIKTVDIIKDAGERLEEYNERKENSKHKIIKIGLEEMDKKLNGWNMGEELVTIMARTNQGKSWLLLEFLMNAWKQGKRVGLYSGEMSTVQIGYRFDALHKHFSNLDLMRASLKDTKEYEDYIETLKKSENCFVVITPKDLGHLATVNDIEYLIKKYNLDIVGIDQYSLMEDYRSKKGDPLRVRLGNISADLFNLSLKYKIPVLALSQANRGVQKNTNPELEHISESDSIAQNSTKVISINRVNNELTLNVVKNRYGKVGDEFIYLWDIDKGDFKFCRYGKETEKEINTTISIEEESPF